MLDNGNFDVATIANWSAAKKSDPMRSFNKIAGVWNNHSSRKTLVAEFQSSDTTLRISGHFVSGIKILSFDIDKEIMM